MQFWTNKPKNDAKRMQSVQKAEDQLGKQSES